jgi:signal transduction histidine kinase
MPDRHPAGGVVTVRLSGFILQHLDAILAEWDAFARTLGPAAEEMSALALRDHARPILMAVAADMALPETPREALEKSQGRQPMEVGSAAGTHGTLRHVSGFSLLQLTAEYRALRATVLRLWLPEVREFDEDVARDMVRFNETIDQALAESVLTYSEQGVRTRDTFLAMLGHDLRSPLATVSMAGDFLAREHAADSAVGSIALRLRRSAASMTTMVNDLLEYARTQLGGTIPIDSAVQDMAPACTAAVEAARDAHPECMFDARLDGDLACNFDYERLQQVFSNLLNNAAQYSAHGAPVELHAWGDADAVVVQVRNRGSVIPGNAMAMIFNPLVQLAPAPGDRGRPSTSIGLGLFIAREITQAHGGSIAVDSSDADGTVFTLRIPRLLSGQEMGRIQASG